jgi:hypothetical protein
MCMKESGMSRRAFFKGALAFSAAKVLGDEAQAESIVAPETSQIPQPRPENIEAAAAEEMTAEKQAFYEEFAVAYKNAAELTVAQSEQYLSELPQITENGADVVPGDGRTEFEYLRASLQLPNFESVAAEEIRRLLPALGVVESRMRSGEVNRSSGASGILQFMRATWQEHGRGDILDIRNQVAATDRLLEQKRRTLENQCQDELDAIAAVFFPDDYESFLRDFYAPVILSCFNAGGGNVRNVIQGFFFEFTDRAKVEQYLLANGINPAGRDVFALMVQLEAQKDWDAEYGPQAREYVLKVWGARQSMEVGWSEAQRAHLLGELPDGALAEAV